MSTMMREAQKLRDIITLEKGKPPAQQPYFGPDAESYLTPEYLRGRGAAEPVKASANAVRVSDGDAIVLWDGSNAGEFFRGRKGILASTMSRIQHGETFGVEYFFYAVKSWESYLKGQTSGSGIPHVDKEVFGKIEILRFDKPEQTKIAEILSTVDRAIEQTEAIIAKQQRIKTGLMQDLLTHGIDGHGNLRSEETHEFKDSPLGRIPVEWEAVPLKELCHIKHGYAFSGEFFTEQRNENVLLTPGNFYVKGGLYFTKDNTKYFTGPIPEEFILSNEDVLVVMTDLTKEMAILGRTVILYHPDNVLHNQRIGKVLKNRGVRLDLRFLALLMNSDFHRDSIKATAIGTTVRHTSPEKLLSPLVPKLPFEEQVRIRKRIESIENLMNCTSKELAKARRIKTALMQDLLTGKKRVTALLHDTEVVHG